MKKILAGIAAFLLIYFILTAASNNVSGGFSKVLYLLGDDQENLSNEITDNVVSNAEGVVVGASKVDGSNWSIPNIIRNFLGGDE